MLEILEIGYGDEIDHREEANGKLQQNKDKEDACPKAESPSLLV